MVEYYCFLHVAGRGWTADHVCCGQCVRPRNGSVLELACLRRLSAYSSSRFIQQTLFLQPWFSVQRRSSRFERSQVLLSGTGEVTEYQNDPNVHLGTHSATRVAGIPNISKLSPLKKS